MRILTMTVMLVFSACGDLANKNDFGANIRKASQKHSNEVFGVEEASFLVAGERVAAEVAQDEEQVVDQNGLFVGLPESAFGNRYLFGGVITQAADKHDSTLGLLKLSNIAPMHVIPILSDDKKAVSFHGCAQDCSGDTFADRIFTVRVLGEQEREGQTFYLLDLADLTREMKIVDKVSTFLSRGFLSVKSSEIVSTDYSENTFVFDVKTTMGPLVLTYRKPTHVVSRWYLRPSKPIVAEAFVSRRPKKESGFFLTQRLKKSLVTRFAKPSENQNRKVKYYVKGVPAIARPGVIAAFDDWNQTFVALTGEELLSFEFVDADDPRYDKLMTGDIRYNVIEWDISNKAPYGGLGPSMAFQPTGQILSGNVLVQGPAIIAMHRKWFGLDAKSVESSTEPRANLSVQFSEALAFNVPASMPEYRDPMMAPGDAANPPPAGVSYEEYMNGYFHELIAHELGHNLGLRHNFKGNLGAADEPEFGGNASRSVMDYLGRAHRHLVRVGSYDRMAVAYAYQGQEPQSSNWFCTDQDVISVKNLSASPECQRYDLSNDPYAYWRSELARSLAAYASFTKTDNGGQKALAEKSLKMAVDGMMAYAATAETSSQSWASWQRTEDRPDSPEGIKSFVAGDITGAICTSDGDPDWPAVKTYMFEAAATWGLDVKKYLCPKSIEATVEVR